MGHHGVLFWMHEPAVIRLERVKAMPKTAARNPPIGGLREVMCFPNPQMRMDIPCAWKDCITNEGMSHAPFRGDRTAVRLRSRSNVYHGLPLQAVSH